MKDHTFVDVPCSNKGWDDTVSSRYDTYTIHIYIHDFKIKNFGFQQQSECFGLIYRVNQTNTSAKAK